MNMSRPFGWLTRTDNKDRGVRKNLSRRAARLAAAAGGATGAQGLEQLENRQLLFTVSIGPADVNQATGLGTRTVDFSYFVPFRAITTTITPVADIAITENFDDEMDPWTQNNPPVPPNGTQFMGSRIQISYSSASTAPAQLIRRPNGTNPPDQALRVALTGTDTMTFTLYDPNGMAGDTPRLSKHLVLEVSRQTFPLPSDGDDLNTNATTGTRVELLNNGTVVQTFSGAALEALRQAAFEQPLGFTDSKFTFDFAAGFDAIRFSSAASTPNNSTYSDNFVVESINATLPGGTYAQWVDNQVRDVRLTFTGPAGASVTLQDLYGRDMLQRAGVRIRNGGRISPIDLNDDGVPDFNDGIGRVLVSGTNAASSLTMIGYIYDVNAAAGTPPQIFPAGPGDLNSTIAGTNFGFETVQNGTSPPVVMGLPPVGVGLVLGSPFVRDNSSGTNYRTNPTALDFNRTDQGLFVTSGASLGNVLIAGAVFGSSHIEGATSRFSVGFMAGSMRVDGDLGSFISQTDSGGWWSTNAGQFLATNSRITIGRTSREIDIGGRNLSTISVLADVNNPARARIVQNDFFSRETVYGFSTQTNGPQATILRTIAASPNWASTGQAIPFGAGYYRNDSLSSAEFVGYNGTSVRIFGSVNGLDPVNTAFDSTDVYAFPADTTREVVIAAGILTGSIRIVDRDGRVLAALDLTGGAGRGPNGNNNLSSIIRFQPDHADTYYLVINNEAQAATTNNPGAEPQYQVSVSGMAPVTMGALRIGSGSGLSTTPYVFTLAAGDMGSVRIGTGYYTSGGGESDTSDIILGIPSNTDVRNLLSWRNSTISVPGNLYNVTAGASINGAQLLVRGNLGTLVTGTAEVLGRSVLNGDIFNADIRIGGSIALMDIKGGLGISQIHTSGQPDSRGGTVGIITGTVPGLKGDIGQILVGAYMSGVNVSIRTSPGSQFDQFIIGANNDGAGSESPGVIKDAAPLISVGDGSDVRFFSFARLENGPSTDVFLQIVYGQTISFVDDAGATVTISLSGGPDPANPNADPRTGSVAQIRTLQVNGSRGVAIARITALLQGGANLVITGVTPGVVSIGRIIIVNATSGAAGGTSPVTPAPNPNIIINGNAQIDVNRIDVLAGVLDSIQNTTVGGDIVAIDASALRTLTVFGDLGRTQTISANKSLLGPFLGIDNMGGGPGAPIRIAAASISITGNWNGALYDPVTNPPLGTGTGSLEQIGSPVDPYLDGVIVRTGDLENVSVNGSVGDVLVQTGDLINLVANADGLTPQGGFQGIVGNIYAVAIGTIDVGDGLVGTGQTPLAQASIVADTSIVRVVAGPRITGAKLQGIIIAAGGAGFLTQLGTSIATPIPVNPPIFGIGTVSVTNGRFDTMLIYGGQFGDFWTSTRVQDQTASTSIVNSVIGVNSDLFRSEVAGIRVTSIAISGGAYDASLVQATDSIGTIFADEFRNSTRLGAASEFFRNLVVANNSLGSIVTNGLAGDISDLTVELGGSLTGQIAGRNIQRSNFSITNITARISAVNDIRSVSVESGRLSNLIAGQSIRSTSLSIAGPVENVTAGNEITQLSVNSSGPDGRVDLIRAQNILVANVTSSGNIGTIQSVTNDVQGSIVTRNDDVRNNNGGLTLLSAGRDLLVQLSILGDVGGISAVRNIGLPHVLNPDLDLRGNIGSISATNGQIYSDILVGQSVTGTITTGRVSALPGNDLVATSDILVFGRINALVFNSDFNGNITSRSGGIGSITFNRGSFRPGHSITVDNGDLTQLTLIGGDLLGNVLVDGNIGGIDVRVDAFGFKGQIGIASWRRNFNPAPGDPLRNELPPGVQRTPGVDGVTIKAGGSIGHVFVERGSFTESQIIAGTTIDSVHIVLQTRNDSLTTGLHNAIVAGDRIVSINLDGFVGGLSVLGGVIDLGADGVVGGTGADADTVKAGSIGQVNFNGRKVVNTVVAAGIAPDPATGNYYTNTALAAVGRSSVDGVFAAGAIVSVFANAAGTLGTTTPGIVRGGNLAPAEPSTIASNATGTEVELVNGVSFQFQLPSGEKGHATLTGPGRAFYDPAQGRLRLANTTTATTLTITPNGQFLTGLTVLGNANSALALLSVSGTVRGASTIFLNGDISTISLGTIDALGGLFGSGGNVSSITTGSFLAGTLRGRVVGTLTINGDLGRSSVESDAFVDFLNVSTVNVTGAISGAVSSDRGLPTITAGSINNGGIRSGASIGSVTVGSMLDGRISARTSIGSVLVNGDATESQILGGADLGHDANFGGTGRNADVVGSGSINSVRINGNFKKSDIGAGVLRGPSGYLGNPDVVTAAGRSSIGTVVITGTQTGSTLNSEQYRVLSTGTIGSVTVGGVPFTGSANFQVEKIAAVAVPVRVLDLFVTEASRIYTASIVFNQNVDASTLSAALSVVEVRTGGTVIGLAEGSDYTLFYDKATNTLKVIFSRNVTERALPQSAGVPGPGVYQFILSALVLRGSTQDSILDGNSDGSPGDDYSRNAIVGDAGDKITPGMPASDPAISFYGPTDLDLVLRQNAGIGSLPDTNTVFTLRGSIGDHPDSDPDLFRLGGDVDVYRITLRAGQILRMGEITGTALGAVRGVFSSTGAQLAANDGTGPTGGAPGSAVTRLPNNTTLDVGVTSEDQYLINQTGTYYIVMAGSLNGVNIADTNAINNSDPVAGAFGLYAFTIEVFDDGNTGFAGDTASGTAAGLVTPPLPIVFAGVDGIFGNGDDLTTFTQGDWVFTLTAGPHGPNSAGAVVRGVNSQGWTVTRTAAPNGTFGSANDQIFTSIKSSIGLPGATGAPDEVSPDVDIYALNNGLPIAPGTKIRATLRLTETGSNIGLSPEITNPSTLGTVTIGQDLLGHAQFALFETPNGTSFNNARLVAAPSDFLPIGGQPAQTITDGRNSYGYDANGNFFMEFIVPGAQGVASPVPASYALYLQGAIRSDYTLEITQQGTGSTATLPQNVLLETKGGSINWLEAGDGLITNLSAFTTAVIGFTGQINGQDVDTYVLNNLLANLNAIFTAANVNITLSTNPNDFAHQPFSTVILAGNVEPNAFIGNQSYGASQHVDFFNVDRNDQAVVFVSSLAELGFEPSSTGVDRFVSALTGAVARRIGELVGVRLETAVGGAASPVPVMASNSVAQAPTGGYGFNNQVRNLAGLGDNATDTVFYLGTQNAGSLIQRVVVNRV